MVRVVANEFVIGVADACGQSALFVQAFLMRQEYLHGGSGGLDLSADWIGLFICLDHLSVLGSRTVIQSCYK